MHSVGDSLRLRFTTYTPAGVLANAGAVTLQRIEPDGTNVTSPVGPSSTGVYEAHLTLNRAGLWQWVWAASGGLAMRKVESEAVIVAAEGGSAYPSHPWCSIEDVRSHPTLAAHSTAGTLNYEILDRQCRAATEYLHRRTWRRFRGLRAVELRPCCSCVYQPSTSSHAWPIGAGGMDSASISDAPAACGCSAVAEIQLPPDLRLVLSVRIDGAAFTDWRLDFGGRLVRTDGDPWPCCQSIDKPDSADGTFSVRAIVGDHETELARSAAIELAAEFYLAIADPSACRIPVKIKTVQRQGSTYQMVESSSIDGAGHLGLRLTDIFLEEYGRARRRMRIASPDLPEPSRRL